MARTGAEGCICIGGIGFFGWRLPCDAVFMAQNQSMYTFDMMLSLYVALGIFLLIAARNPLANRSLISFTAWSCFAHAAVMAVTSFSKGGYRGDLWGVIVLAVIGVVLIVLAPREQSGALASTAST